LSGSPFSGAKAGQVGDGADLWGELLEEMRRLLSAHKLDLNSASFRMSPILEFDPKGEEFIGEHAELANRYLKREYRDPFVLRKV
jgi:hypothetical protein